MSITYLYVKQHSITGLKYFGKTISKNPFRYNGSGTRWIRHVRKHGKQHIKTVEIWGFDDLDLCTEFALKFSKDNNIIKSADWANLAFENGKDGGTRTNNAFTWWSKLPKTDKFKIERSKFATEQHKNRDDSFYKNPKRITKISSTLKEKPVVMCPHCGKSAKALGRFLGSHFDKCSYRKII